MSVFYKCRLCRRISKEKMDEMTFWDPAKREVPGIQEGNSCYITDHVCVTCAGFYRAYVRKAEREAAYILLRNEDPVTKLIEAQEEMPANSDGAWKFIVAHDDLSNEILDRIRVIWQEGLDVPMTIGEVVKHLMQQEKEAAADADEPVESEDF